MSNTAGLVAPWQPGQSGNPRGRPKGTRNVSKRVRHALDVLMEERVPDQLLNDMPEKLREIMPPDVTFAEVAALRVAVTAIRGNARDAMAAAMAILGTQAKPDPDARLAKPEPPRLPSTEEQRKAVADQLGVTDEKPSGPLQ